jgi:hypothetical protein
MQSYQWFLLGVMVGWAPGLLILATIARRAISDENEAPHYLNEQPNQ